MLSLFGQRKSCKINVLSVLMYGNDIYKDSV